MSSSDFHPVWPAQPSGVLTDLALPEMATDRAERQAGPNPPLMELKEGEEAGSGGAGESQTPAGQDLVQGAYERGFADGREQGVAEGYERILPALETLTGVAQALEQTQADFRLDLERGLHALSLAVAKHLIQREVKADPTIVSDLVARAIDLVPRDVTLEVRLNPDDLELLQEQLDQLEIGGRPLHFQWMGDASLERGSFLLETPLRVVDGRTDEALRALYDRLGHE